MFLNRLQKLRWIDRCSNTSHIKPYSVAQHSFYMALYGLIFARVENERIANDEVNNSIHPFSPDREVFYDLEKVMSKALVHDLEESLTGDILFPLHNDYPDFKEKLDSIREQSATSILFEELPKKVKNDFIHDWRHAKDESPEGTLVACMDKFEIIMYCLTEFELGNMGILAIYNNARRIIKEEFDIPSVNQAVKEIGSVVLSKYTVPSIWK